VLQASCPLDAPLLVRKQPAADWHQSTTRESSMADTARLIVGGKEYELPVVVGTEGERGIDVSKLLATAGLDSHDDRSAHTGSTRSAVPILDGDRGILRYRGYPIEQLAGQCDFLEGRTPAHLRRIADAAAVRDISRIIQHHTMIHEVMRAFYNGFPRDAHPMAILSSVISALSTFYQDSLNPNDARQVEISIHRLLAKLPTIAAYAYKKSIGQPFIYPRNHMQYAENFLHMMFATPCEEYEVDPTRWRHSTCSSSSTPTTSRTAAPRPCGWSARPTPTCLRPSVPASAPCGGRCTAGPTRPWC
jgi:citrate synthase